MVNLLASMVDNIKTHNDFKEFLNTEVANGDPSGDPGPGDGAPLVGPGIQAGPNGFIITGQATPGGGAFRPI